MIHLHIDNSTVGNLSDKTMALSPALPNAQTLLECASRPLCPISISLFEFSIKEWPDLSEFVGLDAVERGLCLWAPSLDRDLRRHAAHREGAAAVARVDQQAHVRLPRTQLDQMGATTRLTRPMGLILTDRRTTAESEGTEKRMVGK